MALFGPLKSPTLISRKIDMSDRKVQNFHTVPNYHKFCDFKWLCDTTQNNVKVGNTVS